MKLKSYYSPDGYEEGAHWSYFDGCYLNGGDVDMAPFMLHYLDTGSLLLDSGEVPGVLNELFDEDSGEPLCLMAYKGQNVTELVAEMLDLSNKYIEVMIYESW